MKRILTTLILLNLIYGSSKAQNFPISYSIKRSYQECSQCQVETRSNWSLVDPNSYSDKIRDAIENKIFVEKSYAENVGYYLDVNEKDYDKECEVSRSGKHVWKDKVSYLNDNKMSKEYFLNYDTKEAQKNEQLRKEEEENLKKQHAAQQDAQNFKTFNRELSNVFENKNLESVDAFNEIIKYKIEITNYINKGSSLANLATDEYNGLLRNLDNLLTKIMFELINSIDVNSDESFELTKSYFKVYNSNDFKEIEKLITDNITTIYFYDKIKSNILLVDKFISFKKKISKLKTKILSDNEKRIVGKWSFNSSEKNITIELNENREIIFIEEYKASDTKKYTGVKKINFGFWEYNEELTYYPLKECNFIGFTNMLLKKDKKLETIKKFESNFLIGEEFSVKSYKKAINLLTTMTSNLRGDVSMFKNQAKILDFLRNEQSDLDNLLYTLDQYSNNDLSEIIPLGNKKVKYDLPNIKSRVDNIREKYLKCSDDFEKTWLSIDKQIKKMIDLEIEVCNDIQSKNSTNYMNKNEPIKLNLRFEGNKALYEGTTGKKLK